MAESRRRLVDHHWNGHPIIIREQVNINSYDCGLTIRSSRRRFVARLNSGVRRDQESTRLTTSF